MTGKVVSVHKARLFLLKLCRILTDMQQITDIAYQPICIGRNYYRYRYIGFDDMGYIGWYSISADTDMPTQLKSAHQSLRHPMNQQASALVAFAFVKLAVWNTIYSSLVKLGLGGNNTPRPHVKAAYFPNWIPSGQSQPYFFFKFPESPISVIWSSVEQLHHESGWSPGLKLMEVMDHSSQFTSYQNFKAN